MRVFQGMARTSPDMPPYNKSRWAEEVVDIDKEHIQLFVGPYGPEAQLIALLAPTRNHSFAVQFVVDKHTHKAAIADVTRELNFYLVELGEENPWAYARYHCSTASNVYSAVHWRLCKRTTF